jgi:Na+-transporting methylmalonyl-CoA/oxaloacetate decarboxylase gamma subunit
MAPGSSNNEQGRKEQEYEDDEELMAVILVMQSILGKRKNEPEPYITHLFILIICMYNVGVNIRSEAPLTIESMYIFLC